MTIGIGGWARKPMAFIRALLRTDVTDLSVVTYGGLLCLANKVHRVYYGFPFLPICAGLGSDVRKFWGTSSRPCARRIRPVRATRN